MLGAAARFSSEGSGQFTSRNDVDDAVYSNEVCVGDGTSTTRRSLAAISDAPELSDMCGPPTVPPASEKTTDQNLTCVPLFNPSHMNRIRAVYKQANPHDGLEVECEGPSLSCGCAVPAVEAIDLLKPTLEHSIVTEEELRTFARLVYSKKAITAHSDAKERFGVYVKEMQRRIVDTLAAAYVLSPNSRFHWGGARVDCEPGPRGHGNRLKMVMPHGDQTGGAPVVLRSLALHINDKGGWFDAAMTRPIGARFGPPRK
eukprot:Polyplicarium_translucidae@DN1941_c0_g1_i1.p1